MVTFVFGKARQTEERFLKSKEKTEKSSKTLKGKSARYRNRFNAEVRNVSLEEDSKPPFPFKKLLLLHRIWTISWVGTTVRRFHIAVEEAESRWKNSR
jgi:hypothetical protein